MKKMLVIVMVLGLGLLLAGCLQPQSPPEEVPNNETTAAQECMKTPNMAWCDNEQRCIDPATEICK